MDLKVEAPLTTEVWAATGTRTGTGAVLVMPPDHEVVLNPQLLPLNRMRERHQDNSLSLWIVYAGFVHQSCCLPLFVLL